MVKYIAFLRGINVSGQKIIRMELLRKVISEAGFADVKTYIQSGNLLFDSAETDTKILTLQLENLIDKSFGFRTDVIVCRITEIESIVNSSHFSSLKSDDLNKYYITFLKEEFAGLPQLPVFSKNKDIEIFYQSGNNLFSVCTPLKGIYGFPNSFIEKLSGIPATTRNPLTLGKILEL